MSEPTPFQFAVIWVESPTNAGQYLKLCGVQTTGFNQAVATSDRAVRDCDFPGRVAERRLRVNSRSRTLTGSGLYNIDQIALLEALPGKRRNYRFQILDVSDPDDEAGEPIGMWSGPGVCTTLNIGGEETADGTIAITIESDGAWTYTTGAPA